MTTKYSNLKREDIIFGLIVNTKIPEKTLQKLSNKELMELYKAHVLND